ncbi:MAG: ester cyclase [Gemmataceae bacterium]
MANDSATVARRWFEEVWNQRRSGTIDELLTAESVCLADDGPVTGPAEFRDRIHAPFLAAFPDLRLEVEAVVADGDDVAVRWSATGTHTCDGLGCAPTGRPVTFRGLTWLRVHGGKLVTGWQHSNIPDVLRALAAG